MPTRGFAYRAGAQWSRMSWSSRLWAIAALIALVAFLWIWAQVSRERAPAVSATSVSAPTAPPKVERSAEQLKADREVNTVLAGARMLKEAMKKPETFELMKAVMIDGKVICYEYRARNSFNDRTTERYVVTDTVSSRKVADWNKFCAGKSGTDYSHVRAVL